MFFSLAQVIHWLEVYKYFILFPITIAEGPIITIIGGFLSSLGHLNVFITYAVVVLGDLVGDTLYYSAGYWGRKKFFNRWGHYFGLTISRIESIEKHFKNHSGKTLFFGKIAQVPGGAILAAAGASKMPFWKFIFINFTATVPKSLVLLLVGYYFGRAYAEINRYFNYAAIIVLVLMILSLVVYFGVLNKKLAKRS